METGDITHLTHPKDKMAALLNNEELSDVVFLVETDKEPWRYPAHTFILTLSSPVFRKMFEFPSEETSKKKEFKVTDVQPVAFEGMLRFAYTGELPFENIRQVLDTLYLAEKYMIYPLTRVCVDWLHDHVTADNLLEIYKELCWYDAEIHKGRLLRKCLEVLDANAGIILKSMSLSYLQQPLLRFILSRDTLKISSETDVFNAMMTWAIQQCRQKNLELTTENKRLVLADVLFDVRYLNMSIGEFKNGPLASGVLEPKFQEKLTAMFYGNAETPPEDNFPEKTIRWARLKTDMYDFKFVSPPVLLAQTVNHKEEAFFVSANRDILMLGVTLYGIKDQLPATTSGAAFQVVISDTEGYVILGQGQIKPGTKIALNSTIVVPLNDPVSLKSGKKYKVQVSLPGGNFYVISNLEGLVSVKCGSQAVSAAIKYQSVNGIAEDVATVTSHKMFTDIHGVGEKEIARETDPTNNAFASVIRGIQIFF